jgi:hypothetical protein
LNYVSGSAAGTLSEKLNAARNPLKALRDNENSLMPRRNIRAGLQNQIDRIEQSKERGYEKRIQELRAQLHKAEVEDADLEREAEIVKRKAIRESEQLKFEAFREVILDFILFLMITRLLIFLLVWREAISYCTGIRTCDRSPPVYPPFGYTTLRWS